MCSYREGPTALTTLNVCLLSACPLKLSLVRRFLLSLCRLIAQLYPATRIPSASAAGIHSNHINGTSHTVDLGPAGMYASLEFDDLDDLAGWLEVKASEGNGAGMRRDGMGF